jgi:UDP-N-acetylmuramate dehydrogenase
LTTLEVGGLARFFLRAKNEQQVLDGFVFARRKGLPVFILGGGSNILVSDKGFNGLVIQICLRGVFQSNAVSRRTNQQDAVVTITAAAGEDWDSFASYCVSENLAGIECLSGIPGTVGGTPVQNVGAYGQEVSETIVSVRCYDRLNDDIVELTNEQCGFSYRTSIFNNSARDRYVVLAVTYSLIKNAPPKITYKDLVDHFAGCNPSLAETREAILSIRRSKSMVIDPADSNRRSAGSFFKNPIVAGEKLESIVERYPNQVPHFPASEGHVKIPAAWLIEQAGFYKGFTMGKAGISTRHTLAIINCGGASAAGIVALKDEIQEAVSSKFGIDLIPEPVFIGDF